MRGNSFTLLDGRVGSGVGNKFFPLRIMMPWHRLPKEIVSTLFLKASRARLDGT